MMKKSILVAIVLVGLVTQAFAGGNCRDASEGDNCSKGLGKCLKNKEGCTLGDNGCKLVCKQCQNVDDACGPKGSGKCVENEEGRMRCDMSPDE